MTARILVVDDVPANVRLLAARLSAEFYEVASASSGPEALVKAASWNPDIILLDVMMPGMDGYEVCRELKRDKATAHIPVVMVTALNDRQERIRGLEAGADDFLSKPVDDATLFARLRALLRVKQVEDAWRMRAEAARELGLSEPADAAASTAGAFAVVVPGTEADRGVLADILAREGMTVEEANGQEDALALLADRDADLIILGLGPDGVQSLRFASRLRADSVLRDVPLLLVADQAQKPLVLRGFDLGANDHVLRPVDPAELLARVRNQVRRRRTQEMLRADLDRSLELAVTDSLTGLRNRRYAMRHLDGLMRSSGATAMLIDVDRFKSINDRFGHAAGDAVLREIADRLRAHVRAADLVARIGGEEFLVVAAGTSGETGVCVAERLRQVVAERPVQIPDGEIPVTVSIGIAEARPGTRADMLLRRADDALYRAKENGRNRVEAAPPEPS
ncbi:MAG: PleD family two-component system response regulator [Acetobacteraceae bacterium]|nr:PleD family two-component system response regulator [Acetobacteraceae bacterium]MDW8398539.1 PleD family two-component system response regulator [Acetobacteraceae bacterium]